MTDVLRKALEPFAAIKMGDDADCKTEIVPNGYSDPRDWRNHIKQARAALTPWGDLNARVRTPDGMQMTLFAPTTASNEDVEF